MYYIANYKPGFDSAWDELLEGADELGIDLNHITEKDAHELKVHGYPTPYSYGNSSKLFERVVEE